MKQLLVQYKFEVKWDVMHKLDTFVSFFQPSGDFLSFSLFDQKKKKKEKNMKTLFFPAYWWLSSNISIEGVQFPITS